jgi:hypothetical protein
VTQLGIRLRVLIPVEFQNPQKIIKDCLDRNGLTAVIETVPASLEDVFVAVTQKSDTTERVN